MINWKQSELPRPTRDLDQAKSDMHEWGYAIVLDIITPDERNRLVDRLEEQARLEREQRVAWLGNGARGGNTWVGGPRDGDTAPWQFVRTLLNKGRPFVELMSNPKILEMTEHVFGGESFYLSNLTGIVIRNGAVPLATHRDQQYVPFATPIPLVSNVMVTLSEFTEANGATRVVPGSHRGPPPEVEFDLAKMDVRNTREIEHVSAECPPGSGIFFEGRTWHNSGASHSDVVRYSISAYYALYFMRQHDNYPASLRDDVYESMSVEQRALCGFKTGPVGRIDPRRPGDRTNTDVNSPFIPELRAGSPARAIPVESQQAPSSISGIKKVEDYLKQSK
jgi:ectoine hydroxylase-related dioxygenase (phytanoyl-CoA dioxygenase family)